MGWEQRKTDKAERNIYSVFGVCVYFILVPIRFVVKSDFECRRTDLFVSSQCAMHKLKLFKLNTHKNNMLGDMTPCRATMNTSYLDQ